MNSGKFRTGEAVYCRPDNTSDLPPGLPRNARAKVVVAHARLTIVSFNGLAFSLRNAWLHSTNETLKEYQLTAEGEQAMLKTERR